VVRKGTDSDATNQSSANWNARWQKRNGQSCPDTLMLGSMPYIGKILFTLRQHVVNVDCVTVDNGSAGVGTAADRSDFSNWNGIGHNSVPHYLAHHVALNPIDLRVSGVA